MTRYLSLFLLALSGCNTTVTDQTSFLHQKRENPFVIEGSLEKESFSKKEGNQFMIASDHPLASEAGLTVYRQGGNVVDAYVAASLAICVLRPQSTGLLGGGFAVVLDSKGIEAFDFRERGSARALPDLYLDVKGEPIPKKTSRGAYSAGVPGMIPGLYLIHKKKGKLPWKTIVAPALRLARDGFIIYKDLEKQIDSHFKDWSEEERKIFSLNKRPIRSGELLVQSDLANVLERLSLVGEADFKSGETAKSIIQYYSSYESFIDGKDLAQYKVKQVKPIQTKAFGKLIYSMPPPSSAVFLFSALNTWEALQLSESSQSKMKSPHFYFAESMRFAYKDRAEFGCDPEFTKVPVGDLLSSDKANKNALLIKQSAEGISNNSRDAQELLTVKHSMPMPLARLESYNTTHISVMDSSGQAVSSTHSVNGIFGSGVIVPKTGMFLNNTIDDFSVSLNFPNIYGLVGSKANFIAPQKTPLSSMSPLILVDPKTNKPELIIGAPGGSQIPSSILNSLVDYYQGSRNIFLAVSKPRIHHQFMPDLLFLEPEWKERFPSDLKSYKVQYGKHRAKVFAVAREGNTLIGISDPRGDGSPAGY